MRATKIIATLGPATAAPETVEALLRAGVDTVRLNFSHGSHDDHARLVRLVRETSERMGSTSPSCRTCRGRAFAPAR